MRAEASLPRWAEAEHQNAKEIDFVHLLLQYNILLVTIFIFQSVIGLLSYVYQEQVDADLEHSLKDNFILTYSLDRHNTEAVDKIQAQVVNIDSSLFWNKS